MSEGGVVVGGDAAVESLRKARDSSAVLKLELAKLRSCVPALAIIALEGDDDKLVYSQWLRRAREDLKYAMFPCKGKGPLLNLRSAVQRDRTGLGEGVYFFVDRDFDELRGRSPGADIFMTDRYSVENYLVSEDVLEATLEVEFHCHAAPEIKRQIIELFGRDFEKFLHITKGSNFRLFFARKTGTEVGTIPKGIGKLASVEVGEIKEGSLSPDEVIVYVSEPKEELGTELGAEFDKLCPRSHYRGKFALAFFNQWLRKLAEQSSRPERGVFASLTNAAAVRSSELTLNTFASRSSLPEGFRDFVAKIEGREAA